MVTTPLRQLGSRARLVAYRGFGKLPPRLRRGLVAVLAPSYTVGAVVVLHDGEDVLFVRQAHRTGLALPGGLLKRGEPPVTAVQRELGEELGLDWTFADFPDSVFVDPDKRRIDLIWRVPIDKDSVPAIVGAEVLAAQWARFDHPDVTPQTRNILQPVRSRIELPSVPGSAADRS